MKTDYSYPVKMRDGIELSTILYVPAESGKFAAVLTRTPYSAKGYLAAVELLKKVGSLAVVLQDTRGRYDSDGFFIPFKEKEDTLDTIAWIKEQDWSNGQIIILGPSYLGYVGLQVLDEESSSINALLAPMTFTRPYDGLVYRNGVLHLHWALPWSIMTSTHVQTSLVHVNGSWPENYAGPLLEKVKSLGLPDHVWQQFLTPKENGDWMRDSAVISKPLKTRVCLVGGWFDFMLGATFSTYEDVNNAGGLPPDLILGPWGHNGYMQSLTGIGDFDFGKQGKANLSADFMSLLKRTMEGADQFIKAYILRRDEWIVLESWPPGEDSVFPVKLYLDGNSYLNLELPETESTFKIHVDPSDPVPTIGGAVWEFPPHLEPGPTDQSSLQERNDVLRYFSEPANSFYTMLGPISAELWIKTDSKETHLTTKLLLEEKGGKQRILQDGIAKVKGSIGDYSQIRIDMLATGIQVEESERIGLEVSWSNFPKYELPAENKPYTQTVKTGSKDPSFVEIHILK
jgi:putative CocE/NonD family hydrolase